MFQKGIDTKTFRDKLIDKVMYSSDVETDDETVTISMKKDGVGDDKD